MEDSLLKISNFLKAVFLKFYLVDSWIPWPIFYLHFKIFDAFFQWCSDKVIWQLNIQNSLTKIRKIYFLSFGPNYFSQPFLLIKVLYATDPSTYNNVYRKCIYMYCTDTYYAYAWMCVCLCVSVHVYIYFKALYDFWEWNKMNIIMIAIYIFRKYSFLKE